MRRPLPVSLVLMTTCLLATSMVPTPAMVHAETDESRTAAIGRSSPLPAVPTATTTHGAGINSPNYNDFGVQYAYACASDGSARFRLTGASIYMWARGDRIKGFQFKYRLVAADTSGQIQAWSNWSKNVSVSFPQGSNRQQCLTAGRLGQTRSVAAGWELEVKLKYPRSLRPAKRYKYRLAFTNPPCGESLMVDRSATARRWAARWLCRQFKCGGRQPTSHTQVAVGADIMVVSRTLH